MFLGDLDICTILEEDEKIILKSFFETDSKMNKSSFKDFVLKNKQMQKVTAEKAIQWINKQLKTRGKIDGTNIFIYRRTQTAS